MDNSPEGQPMASGLKVASYNLQSGVTTDRYMHYLTRGWHNFLPNKHQHRALNKHGPSLSDFGLVALQEIDGGSWRSKNLNHIEHLAELAGFDWHEFKMTRDGGRWAKHGLGLLSRYPIKRLEDIRLPGVIPGRGALQADIPLDKHTVRVVVTHLALSARARRQQLAVLAQSLKDQPYFILMGDLNCQAAEVQRAFNEAGCAMHCVTEDLASFPSWQPKRAIDHIVVAGFDVQQRWALEPMNSDHLPVAAEIKLSAA